MLAWIKLKDGVAFLKLMMVGLITTASHMLQLVQVHSMRGEMCIMHEIILVRFDYLRNMLYSVVIVD